MAIPIFVLGRQRSGTTWLANQLSEHPNIAAVRHEHHFGIHESAYFSHVLDRYGDLKDKQNFSEFAEVMAASDYLRIAGISKEFLYALYPASYEEVFRAVMDEVARQQGATHWLEKTPHNTLNANLLATVYPTAKFVAVTREVHDVVKSALYMPPAEARLRRLYRSAVSWAHYTKAIESFCERQPERTLSVQYASLREDLAGTLQEICSFLALPYDPCLLQQSYRPNTSFTGGRKREASNLSAGERAFVDSLVRATELTPLAVFDWRRRRQRRAKIPKSLPTWFFSMSPFYTEGGDARDERPSGGD